MFTALHRFIIARVALALMLFAQGTLALAACDWARRAPALALTQAEQSSAGCMEQMPNVNLCVAHCLGENQSLDKPSVALPALPPAPILTLNHFVLEPRSGARAADLPAPSAGPPSRIRFQSLLL